MGRLFAARNFTKNKQQTKKNGREYFVNKENKV